MIYHRDLKVLSHLTKLSHLDVRHAAVGPNTSVPQLAKWRDVGLTADWIHAVVRQMGERPLRKAADIIAFLVEGAPKLRAIFYLLQQSNNLPPSSEI
jgi:hypothetical protein